MLGDLMTQLYMGSWEQDAFFVTWANCYDIQLFRVSQQLKIHTHTHTHGPVAHFMSDREGDR